MGYHLATVLESETCMMETAKSRQQTLTKNRSRGFKTFFSLKRFRYRAHRLQGPSVEGRRSSPPLLSADARSVRCRPNDNRWLLSCFPRNLRRCRRCLIRYTQIPTQVQLFETQEVLIGNAQAWTTAFGAGEVAKAGWLGGEKIAGGP